MSVFAWARTLTYNAMTKNGASYFVSIFEFLMLFVSLIVGLGVAEVLTGVTRIIRERETTSPYWIHSLFIVIVFLALLQQWWEIWGVRDVEAWTFPGLLLMLGGPIGLFIIANLLFPEPVRGTDFKNYYFGKMKPVIWIAVFSVLLAVSFRPIVFGSKLFALENLSSFVIMAIFVSLTFIKKEWYQGTMVLSVFLALLADVLLVGFRI